MRTKPSAVNAAARLLGIVPVARHHRGRAQAHLADLARRDRRVVGVAHASSTLAMRTADADDRVFVGIVERGAEPDAGLGARVARRELRAEAAARFLGEAGRDRTAARDDVLHRLESRSVSKSGSRNINASCVGTPATVVIRSRASSSSAGARASVP